jgi:hypothetical protein
MSFVGAHVEGWVVIADVAYCGFDGGTYGYPESHGRFWCRSVIAESPWGEHVQVYGSDHAMIATSSEQGVMRHDGEHVLVSLAKKIAPIKDAHEE